jgi:hypothetical protein
MTPLARSTRTVLTTWSGRFCEASAGCFRVRFRFVALVWHPLRSFVCAFARSFRVRFRFVAFVCVPLGCYRQAGIPSPRPTALVPTTDVSRYRRSRALVLVLTLSSGCAKRGKEEGTRHKGDAPVPMGLGTDALVGWCEAAVRRGYIAWYKLQSEISFPAFEIRILPILLRPGQHPAVCQLPARCSDSRAPAQLTRASAQLPPCLFRQRASFENLKSSI